MRILPCTRRQDRRTPAIACPSRCELGPLGFLGGVLLQPEAAVLVVKLAQPCVRARPSGRHVLEGRHYSLFSRTVGNRIAAPEREGVLCLAT